MAERLFLDPNALYRISSANRGREFNGEEASGLNQTTINAARFLTVTPRVVPPVPPSTTSTTTFTISVEPEGTSGTPAAKGQCWMFRWAAGIAPQDEPFYWTIHNSHTGLNFCLQRRDDGTLFLGRLDMERPRDSQVWYLSIWPNGNAKWGLWNYSSFRGPNRQSRLDIKNTTTGGTTTSQIQTVLNSVADSSTEKTQWTIAYLRTAKFGTTATDDMASYTAPPARATL